VIAKPTTEQILLECCRQLTEVVLPALDDDTVKVSVMMLDLVLRNAAIRAAHEIAWMREETSALQDYASAVQSARPSTPGLQDALGSCAAGDATSLHLDDVVEQYRLASEAFSLALEAAVAAGDTALVELGADVLDRRMVNETEVMAGWSPIGR
jgi:hypothetical protein